MVIVNKEADNNYGFSVTSETGKVLFYSVIFRTEEEVNELIQKMDIAIDDNFSADRQTDHNGQFFLPLKTIWAI